MVYVGTGAGDLLALDLESGKPRWKYSTGELIGESSPAISGGVVYIGDLGGSVHAVNAADGMRKWIFKTGGEVKIQANHSMTTQQITWFKAGSALNALN